jgi:hypothetical protein
MNLDKYPAPEFESVKCMFASYLLQVAYRYLYCLYLYCNNRLVEFVSRFGAG